MALSVLDCAGYLRRRLDGEPSVPVLSLVNWAGDHLVNMHNWGWLERSPASLSVVAGQAYINLPSDFGKAIGKPRAVNGALLALEWATLDEVASLRSLETQSQLCYYGAVAWRESDGKIQPRIELSSTVQTSQTGAFLLAYRAGWTEVIEDDAALLIPGWIEPLFLEVLFAFAQAYDEHDNGTLAGRLAEIEMSPQYMAAQSRAGGAQPSIGMMRGGAVQIIEAPRARSVGLAGRVADPS